MFSITSVLICCLFMINLFEHSSKHLFFVQTMLCLDRLKYHNIKLGQRGKKSEQSLVVNHDGLVGHPAEVWLAGVFWYFGTVRGGYKKQTWKEGWKELNSPLGSPSLPLVLS